MDYKTYHLLAAARTRNWAIVLAHLLSAPLASIIYSMKQKNPWPATVATLVFTLGIPLSVVDFGFVSFIGAPVTSIVMLCGKAGDSRRRLGIYSAEEADIMFYQGGTK